MNKPRANEIDLLRFLAALAVVFFHYAFRGYVAHSSGMPYPLLEAAAKYGSYGVRVETMGATHKVVSNLVVFDNTTSGAQCFSTKSLTLASFAAFDNNLCYSAGSINYSANYRSLTEAQAAGFDRNGSNKDPMLVAVPSVANGYMIKGKDGSPLLSAGNTLYSVLKGVSNIGAYDLTPPAAPTAVTIK